MYDSTNEALYRCKSSRRRKMQKQKTDNTSDRAELISERDAILAELGEMNSRPMQYAFAN